MTNDHPASDNATTSPTASEDIPHGLRTAGVAGMVLETTLGLLGVALAVWFGARRPTIAVLVVALLLIGYALVHAWQRYQERPDRVRRVRHAQGPRRES